MNEFLKRHLLWVGFLAVLLPLLVILLLQYRSLTALETALPAWRKEEMKNFLREVVRLNDAYYRQQAEQALRVPAGLIGRRQGGVMILPGVGETPLPHLGGVAEHFRAQRFPGAQRFFVGVVARNHGMLRSAIAFYDPVSATLKLDAMAPEWFPIHLAFAPYQIKIEEFAAVKQQPTGVDEAPDHHLLFQPIVDETGRIAGMAGVVLDARYFVETVLPEAIRQAAAQHFSGQPGAVIVTAHDVENRLRFVTQPHAPAAATEAEAVLNGELVFRDWVLGVRWTGLTEAQKARRVFLLNLTLTALMALLLLGGLLLALRTAAREIRLSQMKSDFVSNVSHELRTPLSSIRVFGELLQQGLVIEPAMAREFGGYIETESRRLTQLINRLLDFARIESGRKVYKFEADDLGRVVAETLKTEETRLKQVGFSLQLELPPQPLPPARLDAEALAQAFTNLLDNAARYSGAARQIKVALTGGKTEVTLAVTDYGIGIAPAEQEKIFEKFYRVSTGLVHDVKGSGLGLAIVRHIVHAHGGQVTVASQPGRGSTFTIHLPVGEAPATSTAKRRTGPPNKQPQNKLS